MNASKLLNSEPSIGGIVREFAAETLRQAADHPETLPAWVAGEASRMNALFIGPGLDRSYPDLERDPQWNVPDGLGKNLCIQMRIDAETRKAVEAAFAMFASSVLNTVAMPEAKAKAYLHDVCKMMTAALLGVPGPWVLPE